MTTARVRVPVLARLLLAELAEQRGEPDELVLEKLIHGAAVAALGEKLAAEAQADVAVRVAAEDSDVAR